MLLIDSCILIDALRKHLPAQNFLKNTSPMVISVLTTAEMFAGCKPSKLEEMEEFLAIFPVLDVSNKIAKQGGIWRQQYHPSHGVGIVDALLAATALEHGLRLVTLNTKHFPMLTDVLKPY